MSRTEDSVRLVLNVVEDEDGDRLDRLIAAKVTDVSRSYVQNLVKEGKVWVNGEVARPALRVHEGDRVEVRLPPVEKLDEIVPYHLSVPILYEDDEVMVFDKPAGLVAHPAPGHERGTLVNVVRALRPDLRFPSPDRLGLVHRLDKDTSGVIVVAKTEEARLHLLRQWQAREVVKRYTTLVHGTFDENEGTVDAPISRDPNNRKRMGVATSGRPALSHFTVLERFKESTLLDVQIETGRTHQIRVHMAFIGHPVVGDQTYGKRPFSVPVVRQFLHASYLKFILPGDNQPIEIETGLPAELLEVLRQLRAMN